MPQVDILKHLRNILADAYLTEADASADIEAPLGALCPEGAPAFGYCELRGDEVSVTVTYIYVRVVIYPVIANLRRSRT